MHPRNRHTGRYDFEKLTAILPSLKDYVAQNKYGDLSIDFADPKAVRTLNHALLKSFYGVGFWEVPETYLCPPIPGRADYIHQIADLLATQNEREIPRGRSVRVLDIGVGASCIYPLIGNLEYGWSFIGTETDPVALESAQTILRNNGKLTAGIELRKQTDTDSFFKNVVKADEFFDVSICNPPFHSSMEEAEEGSRRKWRNLGKAKQYQQASRNFGGQGGELWCPGGEVSFVKKMIQESVNFQKQFGWFSSLVSKESSLEAIYRTLEQAKVHDVRTQDMTQGQKKSRVVAWSWRRA